MTRSSYEPVCLCVSVCGALALPKRASSKRIACVCTNRIGFCWNWSHCVWHCSSSFAHAQKPNRALRASVAACYVHTIPNAPRDRERIVARRCHTLQIRYAGHLWKIYARTSIATLAPRMNRLTKKEMCNAPKRNRTENANLVSRTVLLAFVWMRW